MIPAYVIHHHECHDRDTLVADLQTITNAKVVDAVWYPSNVYEGRRMGCFLSHLKVASQAKMEYPNGSYLVFEDDCVLYPEAFRWIKKNNNADLVYIGYNDRSEEVIYGTHALLISPKVRDLILKNGAKFETATYDGFLSDLAKRHKLNVKVPEYDIREGYAYQKQGLISTLTNTPR